MKPRRLKFSPTFWRAYKSLPTEDLKDATDQALKDFASRSNETRLRAERKQGGKRGREIWAFRVDRSYRVFYVQEKDEQGRYSLLVHVGPHDDYRRIKGRL